MKLLNLVFVHVLPYCELSFCHRDHCRVLNERFFPARSKSRLRFKKNVPSGLSNYGFDQLLQYWDGVKDVKKKNPGSSPEGNYRHQNIKIWTSCHYWFFWSFFRKILLTGFNLCYFKISRKMLFWKRWNWKRMQPMSSKAVLNGHSS